MKVLDYTKHFAIAGFVILCVASPAVAQVPPDDQYCDVAGVQYGDCDDTDVIVVPPADRPDNPPITPAPGSGVSDAGDLIEFDLPVIPSIPQTPSVSSVPPEEVPASGEAVSPASADVDDEGYQPAPTVEPADVAGEVVEDPADVTDATDDAGVTPTSDDADAPSVLPDTGGSWSTILGVGAMVLGALLLLKKI